MSLPDLPAPAATLTPRHPDVELRVPADGAFVSVLRTTSAGLAARLDFTIEDIEDLRMSVGEACALVLPHADPGGDLTCAFVMRPGELQIVVSVPCRAPVVMEEESFGWQVLTTLAASVEADTSSDALTLAITVRATDLGPRT